MSTLQITIHDAITGEIVTRDFNATELAQFEANKLQTEKDLKTKEKTEKALADKRQTILDRLGLTNEEFQTLIG